MNRNACNPLFQWTALCLAAALSFPALSANSDALLGLLKVLRDKGTLSDSEYQALLQAAADNGDKSAETRTAVATMSDKVASLEERSEAVTAPSTKADSMAWASKIKLSGDMRNRFEYDSTDAHRDRSRARLRYRFGIIAAPAEHLEVGAGLASGGADPRSANQTLSDTFTSKSFNLDYAYTQFSAPLGSGNAKAIAGKFKFGDYLWMTDDLLWDSDIRPEGTSLDYAANNALGKAFVNAGVWVLGEFANAGDPRLLYGQWGQTFGADTLFATLTGTWYHFSQISPGATGGLRGGNIGTFSAGTNTDHRFNILAVGAELGSKRLFGSDWSGSVFGNHVNNTDTDSNQNTGLSLGANLGNGPLSFKYIYANLDGNAFPDIFPDADRFSGATDIRSHELEVAYKIHPNVTISLDYYHNERKALGTDQDRVQTDILVKF